MMEELPPYSETAVAPSAEPLSLSERQTPPDYRDNPEATEQVLLRQPQGPSGLPTIYKYKSNRMVMSFGRRIPGMFAPSYGRYAVIRGTLLVKDFKNVSEVSVSILGSISISKVIERGYGNIAEKGYNLLNEKFVFWSEDSGEPRPTKPQEYVISYPIPSYALGSADALPASGSLRCQSMHIEVGYTIQADLSRKGRLRRHECVQTPFFYLPRTTPTAYRANFNLFDDVDAKLYQSPELQWHFSEVPVDPSMPCQGVLQDDNACFIQLGIPSPLSYPAGLPIPFVIKIISPCQLGLPDLTANLKVTLVKTTIAVDKCNVRASSEVTLGYAKIWKVDHEEDVYTVTGSVTGGRMHGEMAWSFKDMVQVKYGLRARLHSFKDGLNYGYSVTELIQIVTHESPSDPEDDSLLLPALGLIGTMPGFAT